MRLTQATEWDFPGFAALSDADQAQVIRNWLRATESMTALMYTEAFQEAQSRSNGELFEVDELTIDHIECDPQLQQVNVRFQFSASAFEEQVENGGKLPVCGCATLVIFEDGSDGLENVTAEVVPLSSKAADTTNAVRPIGSADPRRSC